MEAKNLLLINPFYDKELLDKNTSLVVMVLDRRNRSVTKCSVVTRKALPKWIGEMIILLKPEDYIYLVCSISVQGELLGIGDATTLSGGEPPKVEQWKN